MSEISRADVLEAGKQLGLNRSTASRLLEAQTKSLFDRALKLLAQTESENATLASRTPGLGPVLSAELKCLHSVVYTIIREMTDQLS